MQDQWVKELIQTRLHPHVIKSKVRLFAQMQSMNKVHPSTAPFNLEE